MSFLKVEPYKVKKTKTSKKKSLMQKSPHFIKKVERAMDLLRRAPFPEDFMTKEK